MDNFRRTTTTILFPIIVLAIALAFWSFWYHPPTSFVSINASFGTNHVNVSELWLFWGEDMTRVERSLPYSTGFSNLSIKSISCQGRASVSSDAPYSVTCPGNFSDNTVLGISYVLHNPYTCYDDMCYFEGKFFDGIHVSPVEFTVSGVVDFETFPEASFTGSEGIFRGDVSSAYLFASLPAHYSGTRHRGYFQERFDGIKQKYFDETRTESEWGLNLLKIISFESLIAFSFFLFMGLEWSVSSRRNLSHPPSLKAPHALACLFFPETPRDNIISATILRLASRGRLLITRKYIRMISPRASNPFEHRVLRFLSKVSKRGVIELDRKWISKRVKEMGKEEYRALLKEVYKFAGCPKEMVNKVRAQLGDSLVLALQAFFILVSVGMYVLAPQYLVNYRASLVVLLIINLYWLLFSLKIGYKTFSRYTHHAALEKAMWLSYMRFARSEVRLQKATGVNWSYLLIFSTLFGFQSRVIRVAERRHVHFRSMFDPRLAVRAFGMLSRAARR